MTEPAVPWRVRIQLQRPGAALPRRKNTMQNTDAPERKLEDLPAPVQRLVRKLRDENRQLRAERNQARAALAAVVAELGRK